MFRPRIADATFKGDILYHQVCVISRYKSLKIDFFWHHLKISPLKMVITNMIVNINTIYVLWNNLQWATKAPFPTCSLTLQSSGGSPVWDRYSRKSLPAICPLKSCLFQPSAGLSLLPVYSTTAMCQKGCNTEILRNPAACVNSVNHRIWCERGLSYFL